MYRSLFFKIILIFVMFMITVMTVVGVVMLNRVFAFYADDFSAQMQELFHGELQNELRRALRSDTGWATMSADSGWAEEENDILRAYSSYLGIDTYRNYYVLDMNGNFLSGSSEELGKKLIKTPNMVAAMSGGEGCGQQSGANYSDYALCIAEGDRSCIIYVKDTQEEMQQLSWQLFSIILQAVFFGLIIAVILSFFLARAITAPIQSLTEGAQRIAAGDLDQEIISNSRDEIGTLTNTFNHMGRVLKQTLEEVSGERQKLETVFSYLKDGVIAFTGEGRVMNINRTAKELFGKAYNESFTIYKMLKLLSLEYVRSYLDTLSAEKSYVLRDVEFGSRVLDINLGMLKYTEDNHPAAGCIVVLHDITSRYELDKAQREFVANVSHELRTPLTAIRGAVESVALNPDMPPELQQNFLNMAIEESESMMRIINDLLTLSRFDNHRTQWKISTFDLGQSLAHVCKLMTIQASERHHTINLDPGKNIPAITGDRERIEQVFINIISNAVKYTPDGGRIDIKAVASQSEGEVRVYIRDNGIGIAEEDLSKLFERFYRVDKSRTSESGGTGLGLSIAKEIVESHGGSITARSKVGVGTLMTVTLPIRSALASGDQA